MDKKLHKVQAAILKELIFNNGTNFASLNVTDITSDHFTYHIKHLIKKGIVEKIDNKYYLTQKGKTYASDLDIFNLEIEKSGKIAVLVGATRINGNIKEFLIQQRLKEPLKDHFGFVSGKVKFGDTTCDTAVREFEEETNLQGTPINLGIFHKLQINKKKEIITDYHFYIYLIRNPKGDLKDTLEGKNYWFTRDQTLKLNIFNDVEMLLDIFDKEENVGYLEKFYELEKL